jgi:hypothetical protein
MFIDFATAFSKELYIELDKHFEGLETVILTPTNHFRPFKLVLKENGLHLVAYTPRRNYLIHNLKELEATLAAGVVLPELDKVSKLFKPNRQVSLVLKTEKFKGADLVLILNGGKPIGAYLTSNNKIVNLFTEEVANV